MIMAYNFYFPGHCGIFAQIQFSVITIIELTTHEQRIYVPTSRGLYPDHLFLIRNIRKENLSAA